MDLVSLMARYRVALTIWVVVACLIGGIGLFLTRSQGPSHVAAYSVVVATPPEQVSIDGDLAAYMYPRMVRSVAVHGRSDDVLKPVASRIGMSVEQLRDLFSITVNSTDMQLELALVAPSAEEAERNLGILTEEFVAKAPMLQGYGGADALTYAVLVRPTATPSFVPAAGVQLQVNAANSPSKLRTIALVGVAAVVSGGVVAGLYSFVRSRLITTRERPRTPGGRAC